MPKRSVNSNQITFFHLASSKNFKDVNIYNKWARMDRVEQVFERIEVGGLREASQEAGNAILCPVILYTWGSFTRVGLSRLHHLNLARLGQRHSRIDGPVRPRLMCSPSPFPAVRS